MKKFAEYAEEREAILENDEHHAWVGKHIENSKLTHGAMKKKFVKKLIVLAVHNS